LGIWSDFMKRYGTYAKAGDALGCNKSVVWQQHQAEIAREQGVTPPKNAATILRTPDEIQERKMARKGYAPDYDIVHELPDGLALKGTSIRYNQDGEVTQYWNKSRMAGQEPEEAVQLPDPKTITKVSTLYDQEGKITAQWVQEKPEEKQRASAWQTFADALAADLPRAEPVKTETKGKLDADLCTCYVISDHHLGMYAWKAETGADYDIAIAESLLDNAVSSLVDSAPPSENALVVVLGDFLHYDSNEAVTPAHKNLLDADGRSQKMVEAAVRGLRRVATKVKKKHKKVTFIFEPGNHDPYSIMFLRVMFAVYFEQDPDITVDSTPGNFHYYEFGRNLVGTHHGHSAKMDKLPGIMAHDQGPAWGRTKYRTWWTGHVHHEQIKEYPGCTVESFGILAAPDAYAASHGYRSKRSMKAIVLHKEHGEVERHTVNPDMFGQG